MPIGTQAKLLRVLEERKLRRLGARVEQDVDVRVLAATNRDPQYAVSEGHLRADLFYRLNVFNIHMPPLREHMEDIPLLAEAMIRDMNARHGRSVQGISGEVLEVFASYSWPGNVRELRNTLERAVILCGSGDLQRAHLPPGFGAQAGGAGSASTEQIAVPVGATVEVAERLLILKTLHATGNNKTRAAEMLGISLKTLHNKLKEYGQTDRRME
jgi:DNA-binding NtrC family response regulator